MITDFVSALHVEQSQWTSSLSQEEKGKFRGARSLAVRLT